MLNNDYQFPDKKRTNIKKYAKIVSSANYFPETVVTNKDIIEANSLPFNEKIIEKSIGVKERRVAEDGVCDSDLLTKVAKMCLEKASIKAEDLSRIIVTTYIGDRLFPMTASMVLRKLNCDKAIHAYDFEGGTNAFLQALDISEKYINTGDDYILILSGGICNKFISKTDARTAFLFGDGVSAMLIGKSKEKHFMDSYFYSNNNFYDYVNGFKLKDLMITTAAGDYSQVCDTYKLGNWKDVEPFYLEATDKIIEEVLTNNNLTLDDIDLLLITESNGPLKSSILKHLNIDENKTETMLEKHGNTMSSMLPILYNRAKESNKLKKGMRVLFLSHGEGLSGGGIVYEINEEIKNG